MRFTFLSPLPAIIFFFVSLTACANVETTLPDDPNNEMISSEDTGVAPEILKYIPKPNFQLTPHEAELILKKYDHLDPNHIVPSKPLAEAILFYDHIKTNLKNKTYITLIDFSKSSKDQRLFVINMESGFVWPMHVAHGKGSDLDHDGFAERFSNISGSNASSLGFYLTAETYYGKNGLSLRLDGLSNTNSNARARAVVVHGATYVQEKEIIQGRSWGCPAVTMAYKDKLIQMIKEGSLMYASH